MTEATVELKRCRDAQGRKIATEDGQSVDRSRPCECPKSRGEVRYQVEATGIRGRACAGCRGFIGLVW